MRAPLFFPSFHNDLRYVWGMLKESRAKKKGGGRRGTIRIRFSKSIETPFQETSSVSFVHVFRISLRCINRKLYLPWISRCQASRDVFRFFGENSETRETMGTKERMVEVFGAREGYYGWYCDSVLIFDDFTKFRIAKFWPVWRRRHCELRDMQFSERFPFSSLCRHFGRVGQSFRPRVWDVANCGKSGAF